MTSQGVCTQRRATTLFYVIITLNFDSLFAIKHFKPSSSPVLNRFLFILNIQQPMAHKNPQDIWFNIPHVTKGSTRSKNRDCSRYLVLGKTGEFQITSQYSHWPSSLEIYLMSWATNREELQTGKVLSTSSPTLIGFINYMILFSLLFRYTHTR